MYQFKDLTGLTRVAMGLLCLYVIAKLLMGAGLFYGVEVAGAPLSRGLALFVGFASIADLGALLLSALLVGCWIYRANANAHALGGDLTITPGWAVGWYFVPFACLFKPYMAMKEIWLASHYGSNWGDGEATGLLGWWWGLWLLNGFLGYGIVLADEGAPAIGAELTLVSSLITVALTFLLIRIMLQIRDAQKATRHAEVFA